MLKVKFRAVLVAHVHGWAMAQLWSFPTQDEFPELMSKAHVAPWSAGMGAAVAVP